MTDSRGEAPAVRATGIVRTFGAVRAVDGLDLEVHRGEVFGYLGPNGAGKTTTLHVLLGILQPDGGHAEVLGLPVATHAVQVRRRCGVLLEHDGLYERLGAFDNLAYHARIHGVPKAEARHRARSVLEQAGWLERARTPVGEWSRGMKRRLAVLRAFLTHPELVFLDEPTSGFDPHAANSLRAFLRRTAKEHGTTVFLSTHNLQEAESMCDRVAVLRAGRIVAQGRPGRLRDTTPRLRITGSGFTPRALAALRRRTAVAAIEQDPKGLTLHLARDVSAAPIVTSLVRAGAAVEAVTRLRPSLEEEFIELVEAA